MRGRALIGLPLVVLLVAGFIGGIGGAGGNLNGDGGYGLMTAFEPGRDDGRPADANPTDGVLPVAAADEPARVVAAGGREPDPGSAQCGGQMFDVGGFCLFADVQGTSVAGQPTVVFDSGAGENHTVWQAGQVQQTIAEDGLTISYDRAGLGRSDESNRPKTAAEQSRQLHVLLREAGLPAPYLFVSHSIAGMNARVYADLYPDEVYGVVFVDSSHEGLNEGTWRPIVFVDVTSSGEMTYFEFDETAKQTKYTRFGDKLRNKPISVLSATCHGPCHSGISVIDEDGWMEFQEDIATLSDDSVHTIAPPGSEHHLMTTQPQMVIDGILEMLGR